MALLRTMSCPSKLANISIKFNAFASRSNGSIPVKRYLCYALHILCDMSICFAADCESHEQDRVDHLSFQVDMPVFFYIDPEYAEDPKLELVDELTLSYTFFESKPGLKLPIPTIR